MKAYLNSLNERERKMVLGTIICVLIYVYYYLLYTPLNTNLELKSSLLVEKKETLIWMNQIKKHQKPASTKQNISNNQLLTILATQLKESDTLKYPYQLQQTGQGDIQLTFQQVPFNAFITWLIKVNQGYSINIKQLDVNKTDTPGMTQLMVIISTLS
jgi:general secretion pathway protein M